MDAESLNFLINNIKTWGAVGDFAIIIILGLGILITYYWQKQQVSSLKNYIDLWKPSNLKKDLDAYVTIRDEISKASLEQYKSELDKSLNKEQEALKIIKELQERNDKLWEKLAKYETPDLAEMVPSGASIQPLPGSDQNIWTLKFNNGNIRRARFKLPIRPT